MWYLAGILIAAEVAKLCREWWRKRSKLRQSLLKLQRQGKVIYVSTRSVETFFGWLGGREVTGYVFEVGIFNMLVSPTDDCRLVELCLGDVDKIIHEC